MLQCKVMERKGRNVARAKWSVFQKNKNHNASFLDFGLDAKAPQTVQSMQIKYRASERTLKPVIQMDADNARHFRDIARRIVNGQDHVYANRTVGVSNEMFAITPRLRGNRQFQRAVENSENRRYAGRLDRFNRFANHAERKLIHYDWRLTEIGVTRPICRACQNAICANAAHIEHVSDPNGTYAVRANGLDRVGD